MRPLIATGKQIVCYRGAAVFPQDYMDEGVALEAYRALNRRL